MDNLYNQNFLETPDPVTGLQRSTGQSIIDQKQTLHERMTLEHDYDPNDSVPQSLHGIHRGGSARAYTTAVGASKPTTRPTGEDKGGTEIPAITLTDADAGRLLIHENSALWFWKDASDEWVQIDTTPVGMIQMWPSILAQPPALWLKCDGDDTYLVTDYPALAALLGSTYGGDGVVTFGVPNMAGIGAVGAGEQANYNGTGRTKGDASHTVGTYVEDALQTFEGSIYFPRFFTGGAGENVVLAADGIFKEELSGSSYSYGISGWSNSFATGGFAIDLDAADVRNEDSTQVSALALDFYIKAL